MEPLWKKMATTTVPIEGGWPTQWLNGETLRPASLAKIAFGYWNRIKAFFQASLETLIDYAKTLVIVVPFSCFSA